MVSYRRRFRKPWRRVVAGALPIWLICLAAGAFGRGPAWNLSAAVPDAAASATGLTSLAGEPDAFPPAGAAAAPAATPQVFVRWFPGLARELSDPAPPAPPAPVPPPTPAGPASPAGLRLWSDGDSVSYFMTTNLFAMLSDYGAVPVRAPDYKISSRLTYASGYSAVLGVPFSDWFSYMGEEMATFDPDVVVFMVGANDAGFADPAGFGADAARMMDLLRRKGRVVAWVGLPSFGREDLAARSPLLNEAVRAAVAARDWVVYVDTTAISPDGADGVHFSPGHARLLADAVINALYPGLVAR